MSASPPTGPAPSGQTPPGQTPPAMATIAPPPAGPPPPGGMSTATKIILFVMLPVVLAIALVAVVFSVTIFSGSDIDRTERVAARSDVVVDVSNAQLEFSPSADDDVHVDVTGYSWGQEPNLTVGVSGDSTVIDGGCRGGWFSFCRLEVAVALPADLPLIVTGSNGAIDVEELAGPLSLDTTNGAISVSDSAGRVKAQTTNGAIEIDDTTSTDVEALTTNGQIELIFDTAPITVDARSTNGGVTIAVPVDGYEYQVDADTVNGTVNTRDVPSDNDSNRTIIGRTTNGNVTVEAVDG